MTTHPTDPAFHEARRQSQPRAEEASPLPVVTRGQNHAAVHPASSPLLMLANEQLVLSGLREHELADIAAKATLELERLLGRQRLLSKASELLSGSLDLTATLRTVVGLAVPEIAECGVVRLYVPGAPPLLVSAHADVALENQLLQLHEELAEDQDLKVLEAEALTGKVPFLQRAFTSPQSVRLQAENAHPRVLRDLGAQSALAVPLSARGEAIGVLFLVAFTQHRFGERDVLFAQDLARRASTALDNAHLFQEAQEASRMRDDVLRIVSHDLRTPLSAVTLTVQHLLRTQRTDPGPDQESGRGLDVIHRSSVHMARLIEELLEVTQFETGQVALQCSRVRLDRLLDSAIEMLEPAATRKGIRITRPRVSADTWFECDEEKMSRVVANLLGNAIKFTPRGGSIEIDSSISAHEVRIRVTDTGPGIPEEQQPRLFEQYWKGDKTTRVGVGLGLYIARNIVEAHGGRIWVESEPPHGSSFVVVTPRSVPGP